MTQTGELLPVEQCDVDRLAYTVANAKLGEGSSVRCEGPTEFEVGIAREWVRRVLGALATRPTPSGAAAEDDFTATVRISRDGSRVQIEHKFDEDWHLVKKAHEALHEWSAKRLSNEDDCPYRPGAAAAGEDALREAAMAVLESAERPGSRAEYGIGPEGEVWHDYQEVSQKALDLLSAALASRKVEAEAAEGGVETWESINQWCDDTFGKATVSQIIARAKEEFEELETPGANHAIEAADVVICLCRIPGFAEALQDKMAINRKRKWRLAGNGTGYHIPESTNG